MKKNSLKYNGILLITAVIWGSAFTFQHEGAQVLGPFLFGAIRYGLGALVVIPLLFWYKAKTKNSTTVPPLFNRKTLLAGIAIGFSLFAASTLQQAGLYYTTAGKAGFITESCVVIVPIMAIVLGDRPQLNTWIGIAFVCTGLYLLSNSNIDGFNKGDWLELIGACLWAVQLLLIDRFSPTCNAFSLSFIQFVSCTFFSLFGAILYEPFVFKSIESILFPLLYTGVISSGIALTLQIIAQQKTPATHACMILSLEAVFAALSGWWLLGETMNTLEITGCLIMLAGILLAQINVFELLRQRKNIISESDNTI